MTNEEPVVIWSGTLHRQNEATHSLLGDGWQVKASPYQHLGVKRSESLSIKHGPAADLSWRTSPTISQAKLCVCGSALPKLGRICSRCKRANTRQRRARWQAKQLDPPGQERPV